MKALKITLLVAVLATAFTSCTTQDLNEDEVASQEEAARKLPYVTPRASASDTGGDVDE